MLIRIRTDPSGPLRVIGELPDAKLTMLEGLNGIGKTLAVRILEVCTGTLPYDPQSTAWASLREGIGKIEVEVTGLHGADRIEWVADSTKWEPTEEAAPTTDWFESIAIDGRRATIEAVKQLLTVHRLAGDEGITETFASLADTHATTVRRWRLRHAGPDQGALARLEGSVEIALAMLTEWSAAELHRLNAEEEAAAKVLTTAKDAALHAESRRHQIEEALDLRRRLSELRLRAPALRRELEAIDAAIESARDAREAAQREIEELAARVARAAPLEKDLQNARRTLGRNRDRLSDALSRAAAQAADLDVDPDADAASARISEIGRQIDELRGEQELLDAAPAMKALLTALATRLAAAAERGLGDQIAVDHPDGDQLSVAQTRAGMLARQAYLERQPPPPQAAEVSERLARAVADLQRAHSLSDTLQDVARYRRLVNTNEDRVSDALRAGAGGEAAERLESAGRRRRESDQELLELAARRAAVAQRLGLSGSRTSEEAAALRLDALIEQLGVRADRLEDELESAREANLLAQVEFVGAQERDNELRRRLTRARADIRQAAELLSTAEGLAWVRATLADSRFLPTDDISVVLPTLETAYATVVNVRDRFGNHRIQLLAVERALQEVARQLRGQRVEAVEYVEQIQDWLAARFSSWFNNPIIRSKLLPGSTGGIHVDIGNRRVAWREEQRERSRPFEAFSSGEQAFAYTQARLALLDDDASAAKNRLLVLDEFGAFIAHDRLQVLLTYLRERATERESDQLLVILPLSSDYALTAESAIGDSAHRYRLLADQVAERDYAIQVLVP